MRLHIFSLKGPVFQGEARSINAKTASGEITVLDHHRPLISILKPGELVVSLNDGKVEKFRIESGFLEIQRDNKASILVG